MKEVAFFLTAVIEWLLARSISGLRHYKSLYYFITIL